MMILTSCNQWTSVVSLLKRSESKCQPAIGGEGQPLLDVSWKSDKLIGTPRVNNGQFGPSLAL